MSKFEVVVVSVFDQANEDCFSLGLFLDPLVMIRASSTDGDMFASPLREVLIMVSILFLYPLKKLRVFAKTRLTGQQDLRQLERSIENVQASLPSTLLTKILSSASRFCPREKGRPCRI